MATPGQEKDRPRVYVVDGARTPFLKAKTGPRPFTGSDLAVNAGRPLLARQPFEATAFDEVIVGAALPRRTKPTSRAWCRCAWVAARRCRRGR
jgi:acetyl-CoA acetyltransferase